MSHHCNMPGPMQRLVLTVSNGGQKEVLEYALAPNRGDRHYLWVGRTSGVGLTMLGVLYAMFLIQSVLYTFLLTETLATFVGISVLGGIVWPRANRWGALASVINLLDPDVIVLVEFSYPWHMAYHHLPFFASYPYGGGMKPERLDTVNIFSRIPLKSDRPDWEGGRGMRGLPPPPTSVGASIRMPNPTTTAASSTSCFTGASPTHKALRSTRRKSRNA